jgi:hypothetical protein
VASGGKIKTTIIIKIRFVAILDIQENYSKIKMEIGVLN